MLYRIQHETRFDYTEPVAETVFEVRMAPPSDGDQTALGYQLRTAPMAPVISYRDGFGNRVDLFNVMTPYQQLSIQATSYVRTHRRPVVERLAGVECPAVGPSTVTAIDFLQGSPLVDHSPELDGFVATLPRPEGLLADVLTRLIESVRGRMSYEKTITTAQTRLSEALEHGRGVCQDFAHLFLGVCRGLGLPARYVSGYLKHPGEIETHAWCQVWAGERAGWVDVDPTHGVFVGDDHVVTAIGRDYADVPPNRGVWKGKSTEAITVVVTVEPVDDVPVEWSGGLYAPEPRWAPAMSQSQNGMYQSQSQTQAQASRFRRFGQGPVRRRAAFPNQAPPEAGLYQQQGQQQQ